PAPGAVPAARRGRHARAAGAGHRPGGRPPQRGARRLRLARAGPGRAGRRRLARRRAGRPPRPDRLHDPNAGAGRATHTHTPVPAGNDPYETEPVCTSLATLADEVGVDLDTIVRLGRTHADDAGEPF